MKKATVDRMDSEIVELLRHIEYGQLSVFLAQYAHQHASFKKDILEYFNPQKPAKSIAAYRKIASSCFAFKEPNRYSKGYDFYAAASEADNKLCDLLEKAKYFITKNNFKEAAAIVQSIIEAIPRNYELVDDSDGKLGDTFNDAIDLLLEIAENKIASVELKQGIFHWIKIEVKEKIYDDYGFDAIHSLLVPYTQAAGLFSEALLIADEQIEHAGNDYHLENAVLDKIRLFHQNNFRDEAESVIDSYTDLVGIRKMRITTILEQKRYSEAICLIEEGIKVAEKKNHPDTVYDWQDQLLQIYMTMADHRNIVKYAEELFYNGRDAMKYYHVLKKETNKEQWAEYLNKLISPRKNNSMSVYPDNVLAQIYIEERYWDRLLQLVEKSGLSGLQAYEQYLKPRFPEKMRDLLVQNLMIYADRNMGRHHYQLVAGILKNIRSYPGGKQTVDKLLAEFKMKYKARKTMMEELRGCETNGSNNVYRK